MFARELSGISKRSVGLYMKVKVRRFLTLFEVTPKGCAIILRKILPDPPSRAHLKHLLWSLLFLKDYSSEHVNPALTYVIKKEYRLRVWKFIKLISYMKAVRYQYFRIWYLTYLRFLAEKA